MPKQKDESGVQDWIIYFSDYWKTDDARYVKYIPVCDAAMYVKGTVLTSYHGTVDGAKQLAERLNKRFAERYQEYDRSIYKN